jgi:hypothetical protein
MELEQGKSHDVSHHKVGITSVYEAGGTRLASVVVLDPGTRRETPLRLQVGDTMQVGTDRYKVTQIEPAAGARKGSITIQKA